ncbi:hypothetical protein N7528_006733 [Penicillium herquei]|nr:hypothetical protein N7528_006733 [Penicillium herquei]
MSRRSYSPTMADLDDPDPNGLVLTHQVQEKVRSILAAAPSSWYRLTLLKLINEMFKRDIQIHTSEASIDQSNPALGENTGCESATPVLTGQLDAPISDKPTPKFLKEVIHAYLDLVDVRNMILRSTQHVNPCQGEDTWVECCKSLQDAQDRFVQASKLVEYSPRCWKGLAHVIRTGPFPPDKKGDDKDGDDKDGADEEGADEEGADEDGDELSGDDQENPPNLS